MQKNKKYTIFLIFFNLLSLFLLAPMFVFSHFFMFLIRVESEYIFTIWSIITFLSVYTSIFQYRQKKYKLAILLSLVPTLIYIAIQLPAILPHFIDIVSNPSDYTFGDLN